MEAAGQAAGLESALRRALGYELPVWPTGGTASLPRIDYIADEMKLWAERNDADTAVIYTVGDFDPTGMVISERTSPTRRRTRSPASRWCGSGSTQGWRRPGPRRRRASPASSSRARTPTPTCGSQGAGSSVSLDPKDADATYQAEALDYSTWAEIVRDRLAFHLEGRAPSDAEHASEFVNADRVLAAVNELLDQHGDIGAVADLLEGAADPGAG